MKSFSLATLLAATVLTAAPARAQEATADLAAELAAMRAKIESLEAKVQELQGAKAAAVPSWKGAPQFTDTDSGWSFKPRGRLQFDAGYVESPDGVDDRGLGFNTELRRGRIGVEGTIPGGFGYKFEVDFADNDVEIVDALLSYDVTDEFGLVVGQHNNFQSMEELTSSRFLSFMERAAFTDAFNFERRIGLSAGYAKGPFLAQVGVFTDNIGDLADAGDENNSRSIDGRIVFAPKLGDTQLHLGGSAHFRDNGDLPEIEVSTRYRQRPFIHTTDTRFLATPNLAVEKEQHYGLEAALIRGPFHAAGEVHWLNADAVGVSPTFFGGYAELGYYLTGETRGYKAGQFDRTKVKKPLSDGGIGAFQLNLRYDYLDLIDEGVVGGKQRGYEASLIWIPQDHVRLLLNYGHLAYDDAAVVPVVGDSDFSIDVLGARAQVDF